MQGVWKIHITWLLSTLCKTTRPVRLRPKLGICQWATKNPGGGGQTETEFSILMSEHFVGFPPSGGTRN